METGEFRRCAKFYDHICPVLLIGYRDFNSPIEKFKEIPPNKKGAWT